MITMQTANAAKAAAWERQYYKDWCKENYKPGYDIPKHVPDWVKAQCEREERMEAYNQSILHPEFKMETKQAAMLGSIKKRWGQGRYEVLGMSDGAVMLRCGGNLIVGIEKDGYAHS